MALQQPSIPVSFDFAFPAGAYAESVEPVRDFEASKSASNQVQARDKRSGQLVWVVNVYDPDPEARAKAVKVKIAAPVQPVLPEAIAGMPFRPVEFEGMTVTPYVNDKGRLAYSYRATGVHPVTPVRPPKAAPAA
jgi:hypothetical protein